MISPSAHTITPNCSQHVLHIEHVSVVRGTVLASPPCTSRDCFEAPMLFESLLLGILFGGVVVLLSYWGFGHCILRGKKTGQKFSYKVLFVGLVFLLLLVAVLQLLLYILQVIVGNDIDNY